MVRTGMALSLRKDELQVQIAGSEPDSAERAKLFAELLEVQAKLSPLKHREGELQKQIAGTAADSPELPKLKTKLRDVRTKLSAPGTSTAYYLLLTYYLLPTTL